MALIPLLELQELQRKIIEDHLKHVENQLLSIRFNEPEKDSLLIRQHAALTGAQEAFRSLLFYDSIAEQQNQQATFEEN